jgi:hypothetical protein
MRHRTLVLRKETLAALDATDLAAVVGAQALATTPVGGCLTDQASKVVECDSTLRPCISHTCTI